MIFIPNDAADKLTKRLFNYGIHTLYCRIFAKVFYHISIVSSCISWLWIKFKSFFFHIREISFQSWDETSKQQQLEAFDIVHILIFSANPLCGLTTDTNIPLIFVEKRRGSRSYYLRVPAFFNVSVDFTLIFFIFFFIQVIHKINFD